MYIRPGASRVVGLTFLSETSTHDMSYTPSYPNAHQGPGGGGPPMPGFPPQPGYPAPLTHSTSTYPGQQPHGQSFAPPPGPPPNMPPHGLGPAPPQQVGGAESISTNGNYEGAQYSISHRDSNSILSVRLQPGYELKAKPGSMVAMDPSVKIKGKVSIVLLI